MCISHDCDATSYHGINFQLRPTSGRHFMNCFGQPPALTLQQAWLQARGLCRCHILCWVTGPQISESFKARSWSKAGLSLLLTKPCMEGDCSPSAASDSLQVRFSSTARSGTFRADVWLGHQRTQDPRKVIERPKCSRSGSFPLAMDTRTESSNSAFVSCQLFRSRSQCKQGLARNYSDVSLSLQTKLYLMTRFQRSQSICT